MDLRLVEYEQRCTTVGGNPVYTPVPSNNLPPVLLKSPDEPPVLRQAGRAVVWGGGRMIAPLPLFMAPLVYLAKPKVDYHRVPGKPYLMETVWEYVLAVDLAWLEEEFDPVAAEAWPQSPEIV